MKIRDIFFALTVALVWGMNFTVTKIGLQHFPPMLMMAIRFALVALCLLPWIKKEKVNWKHLFLMSTTYGVGYHVLAFTGLWYGVDVAVGIIAVQMQVPFTALLGMMILNDKLGWRRFAGMITAFIGIIIIVDSPNVMENGVGFALMVISAFLWASYNIQIKKWGTPSIFTFLAWFSAVTAIQLFVLSAIFESNQWTLITTTPLSAALAILYTVLFTTIIGLGLWSYLMHRYSVHQVAPFSMLAPVFAIGSAILLLNEQLNAHIIIGGLITILGVSIIILRRKDAVAENSIME